MEQNIKHFLKTRSDNNALRSLTDVDLQKNSIINVEGQSFVNFSSNDYLGLSTHPDIVKAFHEGGTNVLGSGASRLMTGSTVLHAELERRLSEFKGTESALVFNTGYQANVGVISALCSKGDIIFSDRLNHASIIDGIMLSGARLMRFRHNDVNHLQKLLETERNKYENALIITESVFSMDGDIAPLRRIIDLKERFNAFLMVDEAHATGIFGENGRGVTEEVSVADECDIIMGTFSKALGSFGAFVATSDLVRNYLINSCRSFIYSTSLPPAIMKANKESLNIVEKEPFRRIRLLENSLYMRNKLRDEGLDVKGESQIIPIVIGENKDTVLVSDHLKAKGYWVTPVRPPTVEKGSSRIRVSLTYNHEREVIDEFMFDLINIIKKIRA